MFSEMWLIEHVPDFSASLQGFLIKKKKDCKKTGRSSAAVPHNNRCNPGQVTVKEHLIIPDVQLLAVGFS